MPVNIRKDGKAKRIALDILGPMPGGLTDSYGNAKRFVRKKEKSYLQTENGERITDDHEEKVNEEIGYK